MKKGTRRSKAAGRTWTPVKAAAGSKQALLIERWMKLDVHTIKPLDSVAHARALLEEHRINQLPVVVRGRLVGIVTDRDLRDASRAVQVSATRAGAEEAVPSDPEEIPVEAVMTRNVLTLTPKDTLEEAAFLMRRERIGALPIVTKRTLQGILTRSDLLDAFLALLAQVKPQGTILRPAVAK